MDTQKFSLPVLGYYNSCFSGLIKVKILEVKNGTAKCLVTCDQGAYRRGEIEYFSAIDVFPRKAYRRTGMFRFVTIPYSYGE